MRIKKRFLLFFTSVLLITFLPVAGAGDDLRPTIEYLMQFIETSDVVFIRNNGEHTPKEAVAHIQKKYDHFRKQIKTPEDFIRLAATKSLVSGKPYKIRTKDGKMTLVHKWLEDALEKYREKRR